MAVHLHAEPIVHIMREAVVWQLRLYNEPDGYALRMPYFAVVTVSAIGGKAKICGLHGTFDRAAWRAIEAWMRGQGMVSADMERRGRRVTRH